jgi:hypothetical protein
MKLGRVQCLIWVLRKVASLACTEGTGGKCFCPRFLVCLNKMSHQV